MHMPTAPCVTPDTCIPLQVISSSDIAPGQSLALTGNGELKRGVRARVTSLRRTLRPMQLIRGLDRNQITRYLIGIFASFRPKTADSTNQRQAHRGAIRDRLDFPVPLSQSRKSPRIEAWSLETGLAMRRVRRSDMPLRSHFAHVTKGALHGSEGCYYQISQAWRVIMASAPLGRTLGSASDAIPRNEQEKR